MNEHIDSVDIPQQDKLTKVRAVVDAISRGVGREGLADAALFVDFTAGRTAHFAAGRVQRRHAVAAPGSKPARLPP